MRERVRRHDANRFSFASDSSVRTPGSKVLREAEKMLAFEL